MVEGASVPRPGPFGYPSTSPSGYVERPGLDLYLAGGYVPFDHGEGVINGTASTTLEYATADFAIAELARALGDEADYTTFAAQSQNWKSLFNPAVGALQPRLAAGGFVPGLRASAQTGYVEGNALQYGWMVPHDLGTLLTAMGPRARVLRKLDRFFARLNAGPARPYAWLGNEPSFVAPWAYLWLAAPWRTQAVVRRGVNDLFRADPAGLPGNDDLGALSSWYVWSALGLYPAIPGAEGLAVGSPLFPSATISLPNGRRLRIEAPAASASTPYVRSLRLNGSAYASTWLPLARLTGGATLRFDLAAVPDRRWATGPGATPPTLGTVG
jgi:predicted alpha-1,2-mannosidase